MRQFLAFSLCLLCFVTAFAAGDVDPPDSRRTIALRAIAVKDGFPAEQAWAKARVCKPFPQIATGVPSMTPTELRTLYDDQALYLRVRCDDPTGKALVGRKLSDGARVFQNDCVEAYVLSPVKKDVWAYMAVDWTGQRASARDADNWKKPWRSRVRRDAGGFTVWIAVPFGNPGWPKPEPTMTWGLKVGRESKTIGGNSMWPTNPGRGFSAEEAWGLVYFESDNLLPNGGVESVAKGVPSGWSCTTGNKKWGKQGEIRMVESPRPGRGKAVQIQKTVKEAWYPQAHSGLAGVIPGRDYIASGWLKSDKHWTFRVSTYGDRRNKKGFPFRPSPKEMVRVAVPFSVPEGHTKARVGFQISGSKGTVVGDDFRIQLASQAAVKVLAMRRLRERKPDPIHGLRELADRTRIPPKWLTDRDIKTYPSERVVFKDSVTGAEIWKMTRWPGSTRHRYSNMNAFNANGEFVSARSDRGKKYLLVASDGSGHQVVPISASEWCPKNPERLYGREGVGKQRKQSRIYWYDVYTGKRHDVPGVFPYCYIMPPHVDGKKALLIDQVAKRTKGYIVDVATGEAVTLDFKHPGHQIWFTKRPDYLVSINYSRTVWDQLQGGGSWLINGDGTNLRRIRGRGMTHRGFSPDGRRVAFHSGGIHVMNVDGTGERVASPRGGGHLSWRVTPEWVVVTSGNSIRCIGTNRQGFEYAMAHPNTQLGFSYYGTEAHLDSSPDGTKVGYASSMMGDVDFYSLVSRLPGAPRDVKVVVGASPRLTWAPPRFHREVNGYLVYRSNDSGAGFRQITPKFAKGLSLDLGRSGAVAYYYVTAIEHSGLEGRPSPVVCASPSGSWQGPVKRYFEIEDATPVKPLMEHYDSAASNLYVLRQIGAKAGSAKLTLDLPKRARYTLWLRLSCPRGGSVVLAANGRRTKPVKAMSEDYAWKRIGELDLPAGKTKLDITGQGDDLRLDTLFVTDGAGAKPAPHGLWETTPPAPPTGLRVAKAGRYQVALAWDPVKALDVAYYNVYAGTKPDLKAVQARRVASPPTPEAVDWGLRHSTAYHYRVTAVDRRGNESKPSAALSVKTKPGGRLVVRKVVGARKPGAAKARRFSSKAFRAMNATADRAHRLTRKTPLTVTFNAPEDGEYVIWAKMAACSRKRGRYLRAVVNGKRLSWRLAFVFVNTGHGGPVPGVFMWDTVGGKVFGQERLQLKRGPVKVTLQNSGDGVDVAELVLTNDLGWRPKGIQSFLPVRK